MTENEAIARHIAECEDRIQTIESYMKTSKNVRWQECVDNAFVLETGIKALKLLQKLNARNFTPEILEEYMKFEDECVKKGFSFESLLKARDREAAQKPILKNRQGVTFVDYVDGHGETKVTQWQDWACPACGRSVGERYNSSQSHYHDQRKCAYCNHCGQHLLWLDSDFI